MSLRALGGAPLSGDKFVRYVYLDESGIGDQRESPYIVVAGVIVHADSQLMALEQYLRDMVEDFVRPQDREDFSFHAKHLYNGGGVFRREIYDRALRHSILRELCELPAKFDLPVVMGQVKRSELANNFPDDRKTQAITGQVVASTVCLVAVERYMRRQLDSPEVASLVYENNDQAKKVIRMVQRHLRTPELAAKVTVDRERFEETAKLIPLQRIAEEPFFVEKKECSIVQIADAVAWALNRKLAEGKDADYFFAPFDGQLYIRARALGPPPAGARAFSWSHGFTENRGERRFAHLGAMVDRGLDKARRLLLVVGRRLRLWP